MILAILNVLFLVVCYLLFKYRASVRIKPSFWFLLSYGLIIQTSASIFSDEIVHRLEDPFPFFMLTHGIPWLCLFIAAISFPISSKTATNNLSVLVNDIDFCKRNSNLLLWLSTGFCFLIIAIYLAFVPFTSTGFYHNFFSNNPVAAIIARENSLKLLPFTWLKYLYVFYIRFLGLITASLLAMRIAYYYRKRKYLYMMPYTILTVIIMIGAMLPGSKVGGVIILLAALISFLVFSKLKLNIFKLGLGGLTVILPSIITQLSKFNRSGLDGLMLVLDEIVVERIMHIPMSAGLDWFAYIEKFGFFGVAGIPKIAWLFGVEGINVPNTLARYYWGVDGVIASGFINVSFFFAVYAYFGAVAYFILPICLLILDSYVVIFSRLRSMILVPFVIFCCVTMINLLSSDYLTIFITYGYFTGLVFVLFISNLIYKKHG